MLVWLVFFDGAERMYRSVHRASELTHALLIRHGILEKEV